MCRCVRLSLAIDVSEQCKEAAAEAVSAFGMCKDELEEAVLLNTFLVRFDLTRLTCEDALFASQAVCSV